MSDLRTEFNHVVVEEEEEEEEEEENECTFWLPGATTPHYFAKEHARTQERACANPASPASRNTTRTTCSGVLQALEGGCVITSSPSSAPLRHSNSSAAPVFLSLVCSCLPHCALRSGGHWRNDSETCSMREGWAGGGIRDEGACCCCYVASACHGLFCVRRLNCNESVLIQLSPSLRTSHPPYWRW